MKNLLSVTAFLVLCFTGLAQNYSAQNSANFIIRGIQQHDEGDYEDAIQEYEKVHRNDTNYTLALYEMALSYEADEQYKKCIEVCDEGIAINKQFIMEYHTLKGTSLNELKKYSEAQENYNSALKDHPKSSMLRYYLIRSYLAEKNYDKAMEAIEEALWLNPYHSGTHYLLGEICEDQEFASQAMLAYAMCVLTGANANKNAFRLVEANTYAEGESDSEGDYEGIKGLKQGFEETDELFISEDALSTRYRTPSQLSFPVIKQLHIILDNLDEVRDKDGFFHDFYLPFFKKLMDEDQFEGMSYFLVRNVATSGSDVEKIILKNKGDFNGFYEFFDETMHDLYAEHEEEIDGEKKKVDFHYYQGSLLGIGKENSDEEPTGDWIYYYPSGKIRSTGSYNSSGERKGDWVFYHTNGEVAGEYTFSNGEPDGPFKDYSKRGVLINEGSYSDGEKDGLITSYYKSGGKFVEQYYDNGLADGKGTFYHQNGQLKYKAEFKDGEIDGKVESFDPVGELFQKRYFAEGELDGELIYYWPDGSIRSKTEYKEGEKDGPFKTYFENGKVKDEGSFSEGTLNGISTLYHENGKVAVKNVYDESGKQTGLTEEYDEDGNLIYTATYKKGRILKYAYMDADGDILHEGGKKGKYCDVTSYSDGYKSARGTYLKEDKSGKWKYYTPIGTISSVRNYIKGEEAGLQKSYYPNGSISYQYYAKDDEQNGEYKSLYSNKVVSMVGDMKEGYQHAEWVHRNAMGKVNQRLYYNEDGDQHGWQIAYAETGKIDREDYYIEGDLMKMVFYDSTGKVFDEIELDNGSGDFEVKYQNGKTRYTGTYQNGQAQGKYVYYLPNGKIYSEGSYENGVRNGIWKWYYKDGTLQSELNYLVGQRHGVDKDYHENGKLESEGTYEYGDLEGVYKVYDDKGTLRREMMYKEGERHGKCTYYSEQGDLSMVRYYHDGWFMAYSYQGKDGELVDKIEMESGSNEVVCYFKNGKKSYEYTVEDNWYQGDYKKYHSNGQVEWEGTYEDHDIEGKGTVYYANGNKKSVFNYRYDEIHGMGETFYENGTKKTEGHYYQGERNGVFKEYSSSGSLTKTRTYFAGVFVGGQF